MRARSGAYPYPKHPDPWGSVERHMDCCNLTASRLAGSLLQAKVVWRSWADRTGAMEFLRERLLW